MEPSICERAPSGLTTIPQSTAQTIFSTWTLPVAGSTRAWTTEAVQVGVFFSWALTQAMPRPVFAREPGRAAEHREPILQRIDAGQLRQLVHERLDREERVIRRHGAHVADRDAGLHRDG